MRNSGSLAQQAEDEENLPRARTSGWHEDKKLLHYRKAQQWSIKWSDRHMVNEETP